MFASLAAVRSGGKATDAGMSEARKMNKSSRRGSIQNLKNVLDYLNESYPLHTSWDIRISSPDGLPKRIASWVLIVSEDCRRERQIPDKFCAIDAHCISLLFARHLKAKIEAVWSDPDGRLTFDDKKWRDELAGSENHVCTAVIGIVNDMIRDRVDEITLPKGKHSLRQLIKEGLCAAGKAVQLRSEKYEERRDHPAYPAAIKNFAALLKLAAKCQEEHRADYEEHAVSLENLACQVSQLDVEKAMKLADASMSVAQVAEAAEDRQDGPTGKCVMCRDAKADHLASRCGHVTLCEGCFETYRSRQGSATFMCMVCLTVTEHVREAS
eukprot:TRINITY_DN2074_c0_g2_i2.p1 TRINITY_DN2074_c0_g2~~TRINITY_DN2074_c0_g2_i2.p1  ORF type:complete len:326 (+),score=73.27 TRINITY_DN2074_c0_g2_i2:103-1080(+)